MKTFLLDIIPKIQRFSQKLDNLTLLTNKHWVVIDEELNKKVVFIFREKESQLLIAENGKIEKGTWEYLGNNSLIIDRKDGSYLFKHGFVDDTVLALKVDGKEEYALLVNEQKFDNQLNSLTAIIQFLNYTYSEERQQKNLTIPNTKPINYYNQDPIYKLEVTEGFRHTDYPTLLKDIETIKNEIKNRNQNYASEILISFCRDHSIIANHANGNSEFTKQIVNKQLPISFIERLFQVNIKNKEFVKTLEEYIETELKKSYS